MSLDSFIVRVFGAARVRVKLVRLEEGGGPTSTSCFFRERVRLDQSERGREDPELFDPLDPLEPGRR